MGKLAKFIFYHTHHEIENGPEDDQEEEEQDEEPEEP